MLPHDLLGLSVGEPLSLLRADEAVMSDTNDFTSGGRGCHGID